MNVYDKQKYPNVCQKKKLPCSWKTPTQRNHPKRLLTYNGCFPEIWKILNRNIRRDIYYSLGSHGLFPKVQKGSCKGSRGTNVHILKNQYLKEPNTSQKNVGMTWLHNKKRIFLFLRFIFCVYMREIRGKVNKPNTYMAFSYNISLFIQGKTSSDKNALRNVFDESRCGWTSASFFHPLLFPLFLKPTALRIAFFLTKINPPLSGKISDEP